MIESNGRTKPTAQGLGKPVELLGYPITGTNGRAALLCGGGPFAQCSRSNVPFRSRWYVTSLRVHGPAIAGLVSPATGDAARTIAQGAGVSILQGVH